MHAYPGIIVSLLMSIAIAFAYWYVLRLYVLVVLLSFNRPRGASKNGY
jgi:hypothetical protein